MYIISLPINNSLCKYRTVYANKLKIRLHHANFCLIQYGDKEIQTHWKDKEVFLTHILHVLLLASREELNIPTLQHLIYFLDFPFAINTNNINKPSNNINKPSNNINKTSNNINKTSNSNLIALLTINNTLDLLEIKHFRSQLKKLITMETTEHNGNKS